MSHDTCPRFAHNNDATYKKVVKYITQIYYEPIMQSQQNHVHILWDDCLIQDTDTWLTKHVPNYAARSTAMMMTNSCLGISIRDLWHVLPDIHNNHILELDSFL